MSFLARAPIALFGLILVASALQASCGGQPDTSTDGNTFSDARDVADPTVGDAGASDDSPDDRADGMSYGDGYGK